MNEHMAVTLHHATRRALLDMLQATGDRRSVEIVVDMALKQWLAHTARTDPLAAEAAARGYQWKSLFLPEGTLLRARYHGEFLTARVVGDAIEYRGRCYSPRQLVMLLMGSVRNAWLELWIRCPGDVRWHLADTRRRILRRDAQPVNQRASRPVSQDRAPETNADVDGKRPTEKAAVARTLACQLERQRKRRHYLRRDDIVRDEQPDLSMTLPSGRGYGPHGAGRAGPRDRRTPGSAWHTWCASQLPAPLEAARLSRVSPN